MGFDPRDTAAGMVGSICNVYAGLPFDTVKVRLQTQKVGAQGNYAGVYDAFAKIGSKEGIPAFWKGATAALASAVTENSVLFTANGFIRRQYIAYKYAIPLDAVPSEEEEVATAVADAAAAGVPGYEGGDSEPSNGPGEHKETVREQRAHIRLGSLEYAAIGGLSGILSATAICPSEVVKIRLQNQRSAAGAGAKIQSPVQIALNLLRTEGPLGFFRGWGAIVPRDIVFNFCFFGAYETICTNALSLTGRPADKALLNPLEVVVYGGLAGMTGWSLMFPFDVVKSRQQSVSNEFKGNALSILRRIIAEEGMQRLYRGWSAAVFRAFPANGALFLGYEMTVKTLHQAFPRKDGLKV
eukprot:Clim_evm19s108 gene=Clim_evmTU19s108